jgi:hypothetical protein
VDTEFKFELGDSVQIAESGETGTVIGRAQYMGQSDRYQLRYKAADGRAVEQWWGVEALEVASPSPAKK